MQHNASEEYVDQRLEAQHLGAWVRVVLGVIVAVVVSLIITSVTVSDTQYRGCLDRTVEQLNTAHKDAIDALHAFTPQQRKAAGIAAKNIGSVAGLRGASLEVLANLNVGHEEGLRVIIHHHCNDVVDRPLPFIS